MKPPLWSQSDNTASIPQVALEIQRGRAKYPIRPVSPPVFLIGRAIDCDLVLGDPQFPDLHTYLFVTESGVVARFLGNGPQLEVNESPIESCELGDGSIIRAGTYEFKVHIKTPSRRSDGSPSSTDAELLEQLALSTSARDAAISAQHVEGSHDIIVVDSAPKLKIYSGPSTHSSRRISA